MKILVVCDCGNKELGKPNKNIRNEAVSLKGFCVDYYDGGDSFIRCEKCGRKYEF